LKTVPVYIQANDGILESLMLKLLIVIIHFPILHRLSSGIRGISILDDSIIINFDVEV